MHEASIVSGNRLWPSVLAGPAALGRGDDAANAQVVPADAVEPLGLVARIGQQRLEPLLTQRSRKRPLVLDVIGLGPSVDHSPQDQVVARVADGRDLRVTVLVMPLVASASVREVRRCMPRLHAGGVDCRQLRTVPQQHGLAAQSQRGCKQRLW